MLAELLFAVIAVAVALVISVDLLRVSAEDPRNPAIAFPRPAAAGSQPRERAEPGMPAAAHDAGSYQRPEAISPPAGAGNRAGTWQGSHERPRPVLKNWPVNPHLTLLANVTALAAVAVTLSLSSLPAITGGVLTAAIVLLALWSGILVIRSMLRPVHRLRAAALDVADVRLPAAIRLLRKRGGEGVPRDADLIDVGSAGEIAEIAQAFSRVHGQALHLAEGEAEILANLRAMLVNLSHRTGLIADRQLRLVDDLERGERDAARRARLYHLSRLAARARRLSENLLVLAGHELSSQWNQPMALPEVIRAAVSEVEEYERVSLAVEPGLAVRTPVINDLVHLLAELAENATSMSGAGAPVLISGRWLAPGGILIAITDQGFGMSAEEIAQANWRLENPPQEIAASRSVGLSVVARLAARHGIRVQLRPADPGGLTALAWLPGDLIMSQKAAATPQLSGYGSASPEPAG